MFLKRIDGDTIPNTSDDDGNFNVVLHILDSARICTCRQDKAGPGVLSVPDKGYWLSYLFDAALFLPGLKKLRERGSSGMCEMDR